MHLDRMMKTHLEVEDGGVIDETEGEIEPMITIEEEEDVLLLWNNRQVGKR